ncbi:hypothetical protein PPERSA_11197 [Pseudocohnilembus persalinus]|uniref:Transmembrane protein n=1 Tax=Pseudocohnilembus persalinus TaxID=266149 RepID=A0A0V0R024_PSEPJ|nr:hypothetical protein PPERSA_11197 [Pseudocohnilembus persalinus]|eukprot:KRX07648.1 hypothetical protein PPERSA_11197 [Pseudocohnilembus persalinus]
MVRFFVILGTKENQLIDISILQKIKNQLKQLKFIINIFFNINCFQMLFNLVANQKKKKLIIYLFIFYFTHQKNPHKNWKPIQMISTLIILLNTSLIFFKLNFQFGIYHTKT